MEEKIVNELNKQLNKELFSAYLYFGMAAFLEEKKFKGSAKWMEKQATEEMLHAVKFYKYLIDSNEKVELSDIPKANANWQSLSNVFASALKHEKVVSESIHKLASLPLELKDHATYNFLEWFISEQVEEEATLQGIIDQLEMIGNNSVGQYMLDKELSMRPMPNLTTGVPQENLK